MTSLRKREAGCKVFKGFLDVVEGEGGSGF